MVRLGEPGIRTGWAGFVESFRIFRFWNRNWRYFTRSTTRIRMNSGKGYIPPGMIISQTEGCTRLDEGQCGRNER